MKRIKTSHNRLNIKFSKKVVNECESVKVTTLVDNNVWKRGLSSSWGLSFFVEIISEEARHIILMDTGGSSDALFKNGAKLRLTLPDIEAIFISHWHLDHYGALRHVLPLLRQQTPVYVPRESFSENKEIRAAGVTPSICSDSTCLMEGVMSTGEIGGRISEHSLVINVRDKGLVVLSGCAHPGIVSIVKRAQQASGISKVYAVMGGFHISSKSEGVKVAKFFRGLDVKLVSPCHCTGVDAKNTIADFLQSNYVENGSGKVFSID